MRVFIVSVLVGILLGLGVGAGVGKVRALQRSWDPSLEINRGQEFAVSDEKDKSNDEGEKVVVASGKQPRVKVDEYSYDFGILEKNPSSEKGEHEFYIENVGNDVMSLADGGKACFCTEFTISKSSIKPGEKATILFKWDAARSGGVFNQSVRVLTNDPNMKEVNFIVKGLYTSPIISDPTEIYFGSVTPNVDVTRLVRILGFEKNEDGTPFDLQFSDIETTDPEHFVFELKEGDLSELTEVDLNDKLRSQTTKLFNATITMKQGMRQGAFQERVRLRSNSSRTPIFEIPIRGQILSSAISVNGRLFKDGVVRLDNVKQEVGASTSVNLFINSRMPANAETIKVKSVRPEWLVVELTYPPEELQQASPKRLIQALISLPSGCPLGGFMGPDKSEMGEVVFSIAEHADDVQEVVVPVRFAVSP